MPFRAVRHASIAEQARAIVGKAAKVKPCLRCERKIAMKRAMSTPDHKLSREERLAAKLRENLRRRKSQAKAQQEAKPGKGEAGLPKGDSKS